MAIKKLPDFIINQICAGEIAERPSSIIKELVENSIDAGAKDIKILTIDAGKSKIVIWDNGHGMDKSDLLLCTLRHTTSKLKTNDLFNINSLGFRGEALASIASVAKLKIITSRNNEAWELRVEDGNISAISPTTRTQGTTLEITDLFGKIPARLKFLKSDKSEMLAINGVIEKIALSNPEISFILNDKLKFPAGTFIQRVAQILSADFEKSSIPINAKNEGYELKGFVSQPQFNKSNSLSIFLFINGRVIKDKNLVSLIKVAYQDVLSYDKYPVCILNFNCDPHEVDINVHPSKMEVRFLAENKVKSFILSSIRQCLNDFCLVETRPVVNNYIPQTSVKTSTISEPNIFNFKDINSQVKTQQFFDCTPNYPLGNAVVQLYKTYILSQSGNDFFLVDQHAVHERIVLEKIKDKDYKIQQLLIPNNFTLSKSYIDIIQTLKTEIENLGIKFDIKNDDVIITALPDILTKMDLKNIFVKIAEQYQEYDFSNALEKTIHKIKSTIACHGSIRAGQSLSIAEMDALLRQLETTPKASVCNHGRPTFFKVDKKDFDKRFERI